MAAEIETTTGTQVELIRGESGIFDVVANGELLFSKHAQNRFPENAEILELLEANR